MDSASTTYASLFAGGGGLDLGFRRAMPDARCVLYVENDAEACALLVDHMEAELLHPAPLWTDALTLDCEPWRGRISWLIGGPPCQPFSVAGKRLAADDPRNLWPATLRMVEAIQPEGCYFENVGSRDSLFYVYEEVIPGLRYLGYDVAAGIFSAAEVGAPHQRERLFILGMAHGYSGQRNGSGEAWRGRAKPAKGGAELGDSRHGPGRSEQRQQHEIAAAVARQAGGTVGDADQPGLAQRERIPGVGRSQVNGHPRPFAWAPGPADTDAWATVLRERPDLAPATQPGVRDVADGLARSVAGLPRVAKLRIAGNGVVPATAARAFSVLWSEIG